MAVERAFIVEEGPGVPAREAIEAARAAGHVPDVVLGGRLIGEGPREDLDPVEVTGEQLAQLCDRRRLPRWVVAKNPLSSGFVQTKALMRTSELVTVCEEAACPNIGKCWSRGTATFMIAGSRCTRGCRFCNVMTARPTGPPDPDEPRRVAEAAARHGAAIRGRHRRGARRPARRGRGPLREHHPRPARPPARLQGRGAHPRPARELERARGRHRGRPRRAQPQHRDRAAPLLARASGGALRAHARAACAVGRRRAHHQERDHGRAGRDPARDRPRAGGPRGRGLRPRHRGPVPAPLRVPPARRALLRPGRVPGPGRARPGAWASPTWRPDPSCGPRSRPTVWRRPPSPPFEPPAPAGPRSQVHTPRVDTHHDCGNGADGSHGRRSMPGGGRTRP